MQCVLNGYPLSKVCRKQLYDLVNDRFERMGEPSAGSFDEMQPNHKRWCLYWFYSVNIFNHKGNKRQKLPNCFVERVRAMYPDAIGSCYTGFKAQADEK